MVCVSIDHVFKSEEKHMFCIIIDHVFFLLLVILKSSSDINRSLMALAKGHYDRLDLESLMSVLTLNLDVTKIDTKLAVLRWMFFLYTQKSSKVRILVSPSNKAIR